MARGEERRKLGISIADPSFLGVLFEASKFLKAATQGCKTFKNLE